MEVLTKNSIIISTKNENNDVIYIYLEKTSKTTNLRQKYIKSQAMWSEKNISPLLLNESALNLFIREDTNRFKNYKVILSRRGSQSFSYTILKNKKTINFFLNLNICYNINIKRGRRFALC